MSTFELSEYQKRILDFIKYENGNLLVDAKAGSGKTSTLVLIADEIIKQNKKCLFLAFNKSIVEELKTKIISDSCQIKTLHSLGLSFLRSFLYKKHGENYVIDIDQHDEQIKQEVEKLFEVYCRQDFNIANAEMGSDDRDDLYYNLLREVASMVNYSRLYNCNYHEPEQLYDLAPKLCWYLKDYEDYGMKRFPEIVEKVIDGIKESFENPVKDEADIPHYRVTYTDMIYFPCLYKMRPPFSLRTFLDYVLVDECIQGDMYVTTEKGKKKIKTLFDMYKYNRLNGLKVKTFNEKTKEFEYKEIVNVKKKDPKLVYELETYGLNKIRVTDNHPILTQNGWKQLKDLKCNEDAIFLDNVTNQKCKLIPNEDQLQVIYGTALGDGNLKKISKENYSYRLRICHSEKQYNYFKFKKDLLHCNYEYTTEGGYEAHSIIYNTTSSNFLLFGIKDKIDMINKLDERGLAILFMDDGSVCQKNPYSTIHISCNSFNNEETKALINKFREFGIEVENKPHVNMQNKSYNEIKMDSENGHKFLHLIAPYMNEDCFYKNPEAIGDYKWNNKFMNYGGNVVKSITSLKEEVVYDMEVKDNHNFLISVSSVNPKGSSVIVHNCQDLSVLQQMFVKLFVGYNTRMIAVGDEKQAVYAFAGADTKSIKNLKKNFDLTELPLNTCYRCPKNVIKLAQDMVPSIDWNHKREDDGIVEFIDDSNLKDKLQPGDVILARRNNDLVRLYKKLVLDEKISIKFKNQEMVTTIVNEIKKVIKEYIKRYNAYANVEKELYRLCDEKGINWRKDDKHLSKTDKSFMQSKYKELVKQNKQISKQLCKSNYNINYLKTCMDEYKEKGEYAFTYDGQKDNICVEYFDVIESLLEQYKQNESGILVNDFIVYTESFLKGNIYKEVPILSSIHMMKGGEADNVFIIDYPRFPYIYSNQTEDAQQQEKNLQYVALTRPKKNLYLCRISRCRNRETEEDIDRLNTKCEFDVRAALKRGEC